jgi:hypothetical protein
MILRSLRFLTAQASRNPKLFFSVNNRTANYSGADIAAFVNAAFVANKDLSPLWSKIAEMIEGSKKCSDPGALASITFSLRNYNVSQPGIPQMLKSLGSKINSSSELFSGEHISRCLSGLRNMNSNEDEVQKLLSVLLTKLLHPQCVLTPEDIGTMLYSMRNFSSNDPIVRRLLAITADKIDEMSGVMESHVVGKSLFGLKCMTSEVRLCDKALFHSF